MQGYILQITRDRTSKKLSKQFDFCSLQHQGILNQLLGKEKRNESSEKDIVSRINQWENDMIERIHYKTIFARERFDHLTIKNDEMTIKHARELTEELQAKDKTNDLLENGIERLKQSIDLVKQAFDKLIDQPDVELYIEPNHMIDWNHLIYVQQKWVKMVFASVNKQTTNNERNNTKNRTASNQQQESTSYFDSSLSSGSSDDESYSKSSSAQTKLSPSPFRTVQGQRVNKANKRKLSSSESEKQVSPESASMTWITVKRARQPITKR